MPLRPGPERDIVLFAAGEGVQAIGELRSGDHAQISLEAVFEPNGRLGLAPGQEFLELGVADKGRGDGFGISAADDEVDVFDRLFGPAQRTGAGAGDAGAGCR